MKSCLAYIVIVFFLMGLFAPEADCSKTSDSLERALGSVGDNEKPEIYQKLGKEYKDKDLQKSLAYYSKALEYARREKMWRDIGTTVLDIGSIYINEGEYQMALDTLYYGLKICSKSGMKGNIMLAYSLLGSTYRRMGRYEDALNTFSGGDKIISFKSVLDTMQYLKRDGRQLTVWDCSFFRSISAFYNNYAMLLSDLKSFDNALDKARQSLQIAERAGLSEQIIFANQNLAGIYISHGDYHKALEHLNSGNKIAYRTGNRSATDEFRLMSAECYYNLKQYMKADEVLSAGYNCDKNAVNDYANYIILKTRINIELGRLQGITSGLNEIMMQKPKLQFNNLINLYHAYISYYRRSGDFRTAILYSDTLEVLRDSVMEKTNYESVAKQLALVQYDSKESEVELMRQSNSLISLKIKSQHVLQYMFVVMMILIFTIAFFLIRSMRKRKRESALFVEKNKELEILNDEFESNNATKDKFFSIIAHDLKNPIGNTKEALEVLYGSYDELSIDEKEEYISMLKSASDNAFNLLDELLVWSRSQRGEIEFNPTEIRLVEIANDVIRLQAISAKNKGLRLINSIDPAMKVFADRKLLETVIRNLVSNSIKFTYEGGTIEIGNSESKREGFVKIFVRDDGVGMEADKVSKLFKINSNISTNGTSGEKGTGLGLILCHDFIEKCGGKISVKSVVGEGTEFDVELPADQFIQNEISKTQEKQ